MPGYVIQATGTAIFVDGPRIGNQSETINSPQMSALYLRTGGIIVQRSSMDQVPPAGADEGPTC